MFNQIFGETEGRRIAKWTGMVLVLLSVFLLVKVISDLRRMPNIGKEVYPQSTIMVTGEGEVFAKPDVASFSLSVVETSPTVAQAQEKAETKINKAIAVIKEAGVEDKDITTTSYNVYPKYEWEQTYCVAMVGVRCPEGKNVLKGYEVSQTITVKVRETEKAGDLVTKVGAVGVSNISGVEFTIDDRDKFVAEARAKAIAEAKAKAKVLAKDLGVRLGKLMYYNEEGNYPVYYDKAMGMGGAEMSAQAVAPARASLPSGETTITSRISITYEIK